MTMTSANPVGEPDPAGRTLLTTSDDGTRWSHPQGVFLEYSLTEIQQADGRPSADSLAVREAKHR